MSLAAQKVFTGFPEDVFREICKWAAQGPEKGACCSLALLSTRARLITEPLLYREIILSTSDRCWSLWRTVKHHPAKPRHFFAKTVKVMRLHFPTYQITTCLQISDIFKACTGIQEYDSPPLPANLYSEYMQILPGSVTPPKYLRIAQSAFLSTGRSFSHKLFRQASHLSLYSNGEDGWEWGRIGTLRHLTHLFLNCPEHPMPKLAEKCVGVRTLRLLVLHKYYTDYEDLETEIGQLSLVDIRVVISYKLSRRTKLNRALEPEGWVIQYAMPSVGSGQLVDPHLIWQNGEAKVRARRRGLVQWPPLRALEIIAATQKQPRSEH